MPAIEEPPVQSQLTHTAKEIKEITDKAMPDSGLASIEDAFKAAFPDGVPLPGEIKEPAPAKKEPEPEPKKAPEPEKKPAPIPEVLLKKQDAPAESDDVEKEITEQTKGMSPNASERFRKIHHRATTAETRLKTLETEIAQAKASAPKEQTEKLTALEKQLGEYEEIIKQTKLERHPKFRDAYDGEINRQLKTAKAIAGEKLGKEVAAVLESGNDEKWEELSEKLGPLKSSQISAISAHIEKLKIDKAEQLENWKANYAKLEEVESIKASEAQAEAKAKMDRALSGVIASVQDPKEGIEIFRQIDGNAEWNAEVAERLEQAKKLAIADLQPKDRANLAIKAVAADKYRQAFYHVLQMNGLLQEALQKYRSGEPSFEGTGVGSDPEVRAKMGFVDAVESELIAKGALSR